MPRRIRNVLGLHHMAAPKFVGPLSPNSLNTDKSVPEGYRLLRIYIGLNLLDAVKLGGSYDGGGSSP